MSILGNIATAWGMAVGIGAGIDVFLHAMHKTAVHKRMETAWENLRKTDFQHLPGSAAHWLTTWMAKGLRTRRVVEMVAERARTISPGDEIDDLPVIPSYFGPKAIAVSSAISVVLTITALVAARYFAYDLAPGEAFSMILNKPLLTALYSISNIPFDVITLAITFHILQRVRRASWLKSWALIGLDLAFALILAVLCAFAADYITGFISHISGPYNILIFLSNGVYWLLNLPYDSSLGTGVPTLFYSSTTLIPTTVVIGVIVVALFAKPVAEAGRFAAIYMLGATQSYEPEKLPVGSMAGVVVAIGLSIAMISHHFVYAGG